MVQQYDPDEVVVVVDGRYLTGVGDGTFIECEPMEDSYTESVGAQGNVTRNVNRDPRGEIRATLMAESPSIPFLDRKGDDPRLFPVHVYRWAFNHGSHDFLAGGNEGWLVVKPMRGFGEEDQMREFTFRVADYRQRER